MKTEKILRTESLKIYPVEGQTIDDIRAIINKTQDLTVIDCNVVENQSAFLFTVERELQRFPDSIK